MLKIIKFLKSYILFVLVIIGMLIIQANTELALPGYTSDIVNIGIQQKGIEYLVPEVMLQDDYDKLLYFMTDEEKLILEKEYTLLDKENLSEADYSDYKGKYPQLENTPLYITDKGDKLRNTIEPAVLCVMQASQFDENSVLEMFKQNGVNTDGITLTELAKGLGIPLADDENADFFTFIEAGIIDGMILRNQIDGQITEIPDTIREQILVSFVKTQYELIGIDIDAIQMKYLLWTGAKMLAIALLGMIMAILVALISSRVAAHVGCDLREKLFKRVLSFSNNEMDKFSTASLITRSTNDIQQVQMVLVMLLRMVIFSPILGIGGVIKVLNTNISMAWIIGLAVIIILIIVMILMVVAMPKFKKMQVLVDKLNLVSREILTGLPVIRAFSRQKYEENRFDIANTEFTKVNIFTNRVMSLMMPLMTLIMNSVGILIVWVGGHKINEGNLQVGDMMAFIGYSMMIIMSFLMLTMVSVILPRASVAANRIDEVIETHPVIKDKKNPVKIEKIKGEVRFENVRFRYPNAEEDVLSEISFSANPGETTAIIGSTGSGKSTLIQLLPRFYDVTEGTILIDGVDIRNISQHDLRKEIGLVPQKGILFSGDIASNLRFGNKNATDDEIRIAAEIAQADEFINEKEDKYNSSIAQGGANVSGGQKQRLAIARAIAKNPKIYIFDDSFSALDYKTDVALRRALKDKIAGSTVIIVAQRISTIMHAEKIIVLDEGKIAGIGTHKELLKNNEVYRQIARTQFSEKEIGLNEEESEPNV